MAFSLIKAIKSTHRNPINMALHVVGLPIYATGLAFVFVNLVGLRTNALIGLSMWLLGICLFLLGHHLEGNLRAITVIVFFKYLRSSPSLLSIGRR